MYNALNEQLVLQQAEELRRELSAASRNRHGARAWWRRGHAEQRSTRRAR